jgi:hypothetical protein
LTLAVVLLNGLALGAIHCVRAGASGSGSGADWTNAYTALPQTLVRGDTYFIGAGNYPKYIFGTADSGSLLITVKAATPTDHGTDTGWSNSFAGTAVFSAITQITTDNWVIDGNGRTSTTSGYGFEIDNNTIPQMWGLAMSNVSNITLRYIEIFGAGISNPNADEDLRALSSTNLTWQFLYIHDASQSQILTGQCNNVLLERSLLARNQSTPAFHGAAWQDQGSSNITIRNNIWADIEGTAYIDLLNRGGSAQIANNWQIYGNVFMYSQGNPFNRTGPDNGVIACINSEICTNWQVYNNSFINIPALSARVYFAGAGAGSSVIAENNLWFQNADATNSCASGVSCTYDYNYYINTSHAAETHQQTTPTTNPFVNWPNLDFHLVADTNAGFTLSAPLNIDPDGVTRGASGVWSRGAYQFTGTVTMPNPPTNLTVVVH